MDGLVDGFEGGHDLGANALASELSKHGHAADFSIRREPPRSNGRWTRVGDGMRAPVILAVDLYLTRHALLFEKDLVANGPYVLPKFLVPADFYC